MTADLVVQGFAGPGGWCVALDELKLGPSVGIENDAAACATRAAAGHRTIRADITAFPVEQLAGRLWGSVDSPVCITFSSAGKRAGVAVIDVLDASIRDALEGRRTRAAHRREMAGMLTKAWWPSPKLTRAERSAAAWKAVRSASLVVEPARRIYATRPEWVAMEQVPEVLPLWRVYAEELTRLGYSTWCGVINCADYGVAQTRKRAILIASRVRQVRLPMPTHYDPRKGMQLFGTPWISMAEALGWGATGRPGPAVTAGGTATGGAEPFPTRARELLEHERDAGRWVLGGPYRTSPGDRTRPRGLDEPATTVAFGHSSMIFRRDMLECPKAGKPTARPHGSTSAPRRASRATHSWVALDTRTARPGSPSSLRTPYGSPLRKPPRSRPSPADTHGKAAGPSSFSRSATRSRPSPP